MEPKKQVNKINIEESRFQINKFKLEKDLSDSVTCWVAVTLHGSSLQPLSMHTKHSDYFKRSHFPKGLFILFWSIFREKKYPIPT